jgi:phage terminase large subunit-like protein
VSVWIENEQTLRVNIIPNLKLKSMSYERMPHYMGLDVAQKNDGCAVAICHVAKLDTEYGPKNFIELDCVDVRYAETEQKDFFRLEEIADWIVSYSKKFFITKGMTDQWSALGLIPLLHDRGMKQVEAVSMSRDLNSKIYQNLMAKMIDASLRIPEGEERMLNGKKTKDIDLVLELLTLRATAHSKYMLSVEAPQVKGMHDDQSDAFARAVFMASEQVAGAGAVMSNAVTQSTSGSGMSYRRYMLKQKRNALYTNRPGTALQMDMARSRHMAAASIGSIGSSRMWR